MSPLGASGFSDIRLGAEAMTHQDYYENRGDKNGWPINWKPDHMRHGAGDTHKASRENSGMNE